jgi:hypothetical protein
MDKPTRLKFSLAGRKGSGKEAFNKLELYEIIIGEL